MTRESVSKIRVRFAETDKFGYAYHGAYFAWFEVGRTDWLRERGMTYLDLMAKDVHLPVVSTGRSFCARWRTTIRSRSGRSSPRSPASDWSSTTNSGARITRKC